MKIKIILAIVFLILIIPSYAFGIPCPDYGTHLFMNAEDGVKQATNPQKKLFYFTKPIKTKNSKQINFSCDYNYVLDRDFEFQYLSYLDKIIIVANVVIFIFLISSPLLLIFLFSRVKFFWFKFYFGIVIGLLMFLWFYFVIDVMGDYDSYFVPWLIVFLFFIFEKRFYFL